MKKHKIISRIFVIFACVAILLSTFGTNIFAAVNPSIKNSDNALLDTILSVLGEVLGIATGALGIALSTVILIIVGVLYIILWLIFYPMTGQMPAADNIIFNGIELFDPNFFNATGVSLAALMKGTIQKIYTTGYLVGGSIFVIGAMIIGLRLAVSSIASEKAHYKEMVGTWLRGLLLLFTVHIIVAGVFYLNEVIVQSIYDGLKIATIPFSTEPFADNIVGKAMNAIVKGFENLFNTNSPINDTITANGLGGLIVILIYNGLVKGDLISTIAVACLLGQTISLIVLYLRRTVVCIALGAMAPYMVAVDFIRRLI